MQEATKVLVVDDKPENLVAMEAILDELEIDIVTAQSGNEALSHMIKNEFALVLLDVQMPVMDGFETAKLMSGNAKTKNTPIIFLTALSKEEKYIQKGYQSGAVDYILKPINSDIIKQKVTIFKRLYEQNALIKKQASELESLYSIEKQARQAKDELLIEQSKMATFGEMMGFMAHQWKQPVNILSGCFQNICDMSEEIMKDELISDSIESGMSQLNYMTQTVDDFHNYLKPDNRESTFCASESVIEVLRLIGAYITKNGIKLRYTCCLKGSPGLNDVFFLNNIICECPDKNILCETCNVKGAKIRGSKNEFKQVLINIVNNARDAIEMRDSEKSFFNNDEILICTKVIDDNLVISVTDTAGGIPDDIKDKIFEPYFTTKAKTGTGIGLNMVKRILESKFNGRLDFENTDHGAMFKMYFQITV